MNAIYKLNNGLDLMMRPFTPEDMTKKYFDWFHDAEVTKHNSHGLFPYTKAKRDEFVKELENPTNRIVWALEIKKLIGTGTTREHAAVHGIMDVGPINIPGKPNEQPLQEKIYQKTLVGNCALQSINWVNRSVEIAIVIGDKNYWGKGIATKAIAHMVRHAFLRLGMHRVWSGTAVTNQAMQRTFTQLAFTKEARFREAMFLNGNYEDVLVFSILSREYALFHMTFEGVTKHDGPAVGDPGMADGSCVGPDVLPGKEATR
jgi:RimJ/RimL family protein N-acetyltransferase